MSNITRLNIGAADRALRALLGALALALVFTGPRSPWGYLGLVLLGTAAVGFCPIYAALGLTTRARSVS
ncbi:MAG TPA: DUF2892 domain-containing protein [Gemmatimonadaceae bacterium]|jgi:hypothetical protein|nr:DUF2892 domain-containing protein [Gemmatimonadaceae bacterium]